MKNTEITTALESSKAKSKKDDKDNVCKVIICNYICSNMQIAPSIFLQ